MPAAITTALAIAQLISAYGPITIEAVNTIAALVAKLKAHDSATGQVPSEDELRAAIIEAQAPWLGIEQRAQQELQELPAAQPKV